jgi:hypothetical protein
MKNNNKLGILIASILVVASSCTKEPDMTYMDKWLGEDFNQELLWDLDSLAFRRAKWTVESVTEGVQIRKASVKMMGAQRSISYLSYSPDGFKTYVGYNEQPGTVAEMASSYEGALFAISGMNLNEFNEVLPVTMTKTIGQKLDRYLAEMSAKGTPVYEEDGVTLMKSGDYLY